ncbi:CCC motif membrane protein [Kordia zhangzhouensis]|uniref:CCC motif membrane protein n=1 Tax=Kordia zhangzhouensis TaxID=1620405 RepID=UPI000629CB95|nr:CCC motif membrane protein [Kordia zhangzhouensis]
MKKELNTTVSYVLSVISLLCCCFGGLGFILGIPAYYIAENNLKKLETEPDNYHGDINAMKTAKIVALIILIINILHFLYTVYYFMTGGWDEFMIEWQKAMEEFERNRQ